MQTRFLTMYAAALAVALVAFAGRPATADTVNQDVESLRAQVAELQQAATELRQLREEVQALRASKDTDWMTERRAEEVKTLVREVLSDADTRAALLDEGLTAGHDGKNFFLGSVDGAFLMKIAGQFQLRYIWNSRDDTFDDANFDGVDDSPIDADEAGFQLRRTKLNFSGHVGHGKKFNYEVQLAADRAINDIGVEDAIVDFELMDGVTVGGGRRKLPFLREELVSSKRQLAVERSTVNEIFTLNRSEGIFVALRPMENVKAEVMLSDGQNAGNYFPGSGANPDNDFQNDMTEAPAITARVDVTLAGNEKQANDFSAWSGEPLGLFVGAAVHWEKSEYGGGGFTDPTDITGGEFLTWTVDASLEYSGLNVYAAVVGNHIYDATFVDFSGISPTGLVEEDLDSIGVVVQVGYMVIPDKLEPFIRYEYLNLDGGPDQSAFAGPDGSDVDANILTFGANYYIKNHNAKFTLDVVWALDPLSGLSYYPSNLPAASTRGYGADGASSGLGLLSDESDADDQVAVRAQFQLLF